MKLTNIFKGDRQVTGRGSGKPAGAVKGSLANHQIRALAPGQTLQGELISRNGSEVQVKLSEDVVLTARLDQNMNLEVGRNMTFEVRGNGQALTLSPLFANMATDANTLKALDMASLPINETTVEMTRKLMEAGLPIDKNSLQQMYRELNSHPGADISDLVDLHRLGLPVTEENVAQIASYKNLTYQLVTGLNDVMEALPETLRNMVASGNVEGAAALYGELLNLTGEELELLARGFPESLAGGGIPGEAAGPEGEAPPGQTPEAWPGESSIREGAQGSAAPGISEEESGETLRDGTLVSAKEERLPGRLMAEMGEPQKSGEETSRAGEADLGVKPQEGEDGAQSRRADRGEQRLARELNEISLKYGGPEFAGKTTPESLLRFAGQLLQRGIAEHNTGLLRELLGNGRLRGALREGMERLLTITPGEVEEAKKVEELYQRMERHLKGISQALENAGQTASRAFQATTNLSQNVDFLHQLNQMYAYVQLPLKLQQGNAHGDLYVYTNKRSLASADGKVSALLHLDMEHLGTVDVYVALQNEKVSTSFYVQDDAMLDFLSEHMDLLTERLRKRGYDCKCSAQVRETAAGEEKEEGGVRTLLGQAGHTTLSQYAFDVRA